MQTGQSGGSLPMKSSFLSLSAASVTLALVLTSCHHTGSSSNARAGAVTVEFQNPEKFTDFTDEPWGNAVRTEDAVALFREATIDEARRYLQEGQTFHVTFQNVDLAGDHLPSMGRAGNSVRVAKPIYLPRISLAFRLTGADGAVLKEGERNLTDHAFMERADITLDRSLRHDLRLLRDWIRDELR